VRSPFDSWDKTQKAQTYNAIKAAGAEGIDRIDICTKTNLPKQRVWFYLSELRRAGLIKRLGDAVDPTTLDPDEAALHALTALENALVIRATKNGITPLMRDGFNRYQKIKALALGAQTKGEEQNALRQAVISLVKLIF
jgi:hypothetical protein